MTSENLEQIRAKYKTGSPERLRLYIKILLAEYQGLALDYIALTGQQQECLEAKATATQAGRRAGIEEAIAIVKKFRSGGHAPKDTLINALCSLRDKTL